MEHGCGSLAGRFHCQPVGSVSPVAPVKSLVCLRLPTCHLLQRTPQAGTVESARLKPKPTNRHGKRFTMIAVKYPTSGTVVRFQVCFRCGDSTNICKCDRDEPVCGLRGCFGTPVCRGDVDGMVVLACDVHSRRDDFTLHERLKP